MAQENFTDFGEDDDFSLPVNDEPYNPNFRPNEEVNNEVQPPENGTNCRSMVLSSCIIPVRHYLKGLGEARWANGTVFTLALIVFCISASIFSVFVAHNYYFNLYNSNVDDYYNETSPISPYKVAIFLSSMQFISLALALIGVCIIEFGSVKRILNPTRIWRATKILYAIALLWTLTLFSQSHHDYTGMVIFLPNLANLILILATSLLTSEMPVKLGALRCGCCCTTNEDDVEKATMPEQPDISGSTSGESDPTDGGTSQAKEHTPQGKKIITESTDSDRTKIVTEEYDDVDLER